MSEWESYQSDLVKGVSWQGTTIWDDLGMQDRHKHGLSWYDRLIDDLGGLASYRARAGDCSHKIRFESIEKSLQLPR